MEFGGEIWIFIIATAVEDGDGDAVLDEGPDDGVVTALHILGSKHHFS